MNEAPAGWHWGIGNRSDSHYTHWLYTDKVLYEDGEFGWESQIYWDEGGDDRHYVEFIQYTRLRPDGDREYGYPCHNDSFDSKDRAIEYALNKAKELR